MPTYEFERPNGERIDRAMLWDDAPACGETLEIDGETCTRVPSELAGTVQPAFEPLTAITLPPNMEGAPAYAPDGTPRFERRKDAAEFAKRNASEGLVWDPS